jgi:hypothetical protein
MEVDFIRFSSIGQIVEQIIEHSTKHFRPQLNVQLHNGPGNAHAGSEIRAPYITAVGIGLATAPYDTLFFQFPCMI